MRGNTVSIKGNVTRDAEVRSTASGRIIAAFGVAWNKSVKTDNGYVDRPNFIDAKCWMSDRQDQVISPQIRKGAPIAIIDGHLEQERWEDEHGNKHSRVVIMVDDPISGMMIGRASSESKPRQAQNTAPAAPAPAPTAAPAPAPSVPAPAPVVQETLVAADDYSYYDEDIPF